MKKISRFLMFAAVAVMLMAGSAMAGPYIEVTGWANPDCSSFVDNLNGTTTLDVEYIFSVDTANSGIEMNSLALEFEASVFNSINSFAVIDPIDWTVLPGFDFYRISTAGTTLGQGEKLFLFANVTLFTDALTDASFWGEGQIWAQSWNAGDTSGYSWAGDGGSTAPVPEPATLLLLGSGIVGLALRGRRKKQYK